MKKLMLTAAAAALSMGAFALCGDPAPTVAVVVKAKAVYRPVYKVTFSGKTTKGVDAKDIKGSCGDTQTGCYARIPTKLKIKGWMTFCDAACTSVNQGTGGASLFSFWMTKPWKYDITPTAVLDFNTAAFPQVIGKKANKAEAAGTFTGAIDLSANSGKQWNLNTLNFAGLGTYKAPVYKKISGNFAGIPAASYYVSEDECEPTDVYDCDTLQLLCGNGPDTVAFGKWCMKYSKSASKKLAKGKTPKSPSYATIGGADADAE